MSCLPTRPREDASSRTRTRSAIVASTPLAFRARGTFHRQVPLRLPHALTRGATLRAATGAPVLPPKAQLPTRVHARCPRARPKTLAGYSPELPSHVPPVDFCNCAIHEHTQQRTRPRPHDATASRRPTKWRHSLRSTTNRAFSGQGLRPIRGRLINPHHGDRSPRWIYPNLLDSSTSCRRLMLGLPWISSDLATVR
jgi:hypothetical protein